MAFSGVTSWTWLVLAVLTAPAIWMQLRMIRRWRNATGWAHVVSAAVAIGALVVLGELDALARSMHLRDATSNGFDALASAWNASRLESIVQTYRAFSIRTGRGFRDARYVIGLYAALDSLVFVSAYGVLLARVFAARGLTERRWTSRVICALVIVDWAENVSVAGLASLAWGREGADTDLIVQIVAPLASSMRILKWFLVGTVLGVIAAERISSGADWLRRGGAMRTGLTRLRPIVLVLAVLAATLMQPLQVRDVFLGLGDDGWQLVAAASAAVLLGAVLWVWSERLLQTGPARTAPTFRGRPLTSRSMVRVGLLLSVVGVALTVAGWRFVILVPGLAMLGAGLAGELLRRSGEPVRDTVEPAVPRPTSTAVEALPVVLAAAPMVLVGLAMLRAGIGDAVLIEGWGTAQEVAVFGVMFAAAGAVPLLMRRRLRETNRRPPVASISLLALVTGAVALGAIVREPIDAPRGVGALALLLVLLSATAVVLGFAVRNADQWLPPRVFRFLGFDRLPLIGLLIGWFALGQLALDTQRHHAVRRDDTLSVPPADVATSVCDRAITVVPQSVTDAWEGWLHSNALVQRDAPVGERNEYPLVVVAASGGGVRAAWWTAAVMGRLVPTLGERCAEQVPTGYDGRQMFAASGVSGGSVGLVTHRAALLDGVPAADRAKWGGTDWVDERLGLDHLSPALAWLTYVETAQALFGFPAPDRAEILERSWEEAWPLGPNQVGLRRGFRDAAAREPQLAALVLNGTSVRDGCRVVVSALTLGSTTGTCTGESAGGLAETYDLSVFICAQNDLRLSTAALLSARFPVISPAGMMSPCATESRDVATVDGGYRDSDGAETALDVLRLLDPLIDAYNLDPRSPVCIVPVLVQIDDQPDRGVASKPGRFWPALLAPLQAILSTSGSRSNAATERSAVEYRGRRYVIGPEAAPGSAPALGWSLSKTTRQKMAADLETGAAGDRLQALTGAMDDLRKEPCGPKR